jgi:hypothetical protein
MAAEIFVQNPHNHPLYLIYDFKSDQVEECLNQLITSFTPEKSYQLTSTNLNDVIGEVMGLHFPKSQEDYLAYCYLDTKVESGEGETNGKQLFLAINHRFHDATSFGLILRGAEWPKQSLIPEGVQKRSPDEFRGFRPTKLSTIRIPRDLVDNICQRFQLTPNGLLFWISVSSLSSKAHLQNQPIMCLHSLRKCRGQSQIAGGDYSCYVNPFLPPPQSSALSQELLPLVKSYFNELRGCNNLILDPSTPLPNPLWIFDTWVGSGISTPLADYEADFVLDDMKLMKIYSMVIHDFIIAIDYPKFFHLHFFSDDTEFSAEEILGELDHLCE